MPSWHPLIACPLRFAILAALAPIARLWGTGSPSLLTRSTRPALTDCVSPEKTKPPPDVSGGGSLIVRVCVRLTQRP
jgi:hypothetical protein